MNESLKKICKRLAVRIALDNGRRLIGSGNVLACKLMDYALIYTAAHVLKNVDERMLVHFCFEDEYGKPETVELHLKRENSWHELSDKTTGYIYEHPCYIENDRSYPMNDGAIICVPYFSCMDNMPSFDICDCDDEKAMLVGFPQDHDVEIIDETDLEYTTYRGNVYCSEVDVLNQHTSNLIIDNLRRITKPFVDIDRGLDGLSGGGIITRSVRGLQFHGVFCSDKNIEQQSFYAPSSKVFLDIMNTYNIKVELPHDINTIICRLTQYFDPYYNKKALDWLIENAYEYIKEKHADAFFLDDFKDSNFLSCDSYRPLCPFYFANKLIVKVVIGKVFALDSETINEQAIRIGCEEIHIEHICSESPIREIIIDILQSGALSEKGLFCNGSIFIVSDRNAKKKNKEEYTRNQCKRIIANIVRYNDSKYEEEYRDCISNLLTTKDIGDYRASFSIIDGESKKNDIGFIGIGRLEEKICQSECQEKMYSRIKELIAEVWGVRNEKE